MPNRRLPVGRLAVLAATLVAAWALVRGGSTIRWRPLQPGLEFSTFRGDPFCRRGSSEIGVLRIDPTRVRLRVRHYTLEKTDDPPTILEWQKRLGSLAVFNAGQYYPDFRYMGILVSGGHVVSHRPHPDFQAALVADLRHGHPRAQVVDLARTPIDPGRTEWSEVAQSFMLFDEGGDVRVRKSDRAANRTAVGEDDHGRILVFTSEGAYTLHDFATLLRRTKLGVTHAMSMDGGLEAEMCVTAGGLRWASFGRWDPGEPPEAPGALVPLPAVIEVCAP
jgi:hypothetical protein